ncbi:MAG: calcium/sodium antiporter [Chloroflexi bacterium]|nr:calcium/sodium antiporter [Chloroflexota bacterium]
MSLTLLPLFVLGLALLVVGADLLIRGASRLALALGISPLVVGLTVVAYSTSAPELAVSVSSATAGQPDLAIGNVIGSNIFNVLFILGIASLLVPLVVARQLIRLDVPVMLAASIGLYVLGVDGNISRGDGIMLCASMLMYTGWMLYSSRRESRAMQTDAAAAGELKRATAREYIRNLALLGIGVGALVLGAQWLVESATGFARAFGVSDLVIGLTIVAVGTSLPEVAASVVASLRRERDIAVGNAIGSNISNILLVLALTAVVAPNGLPVPASALQFDLPVMIGAALACVPIFFTGKLIARWEGALFLMLYVLFTIYVFLSATQASILPEFQAALIFFVIPLVVATLLGTTLRAVWLERVSTNSAIERHRNE